MPTDVVYGYAGGFIDTATVTGPSGAPGEILQFTAVIGPLRVLDGMQGETSRGPSAVECYQFTLNYHARAAEKKIHCPAGAMAQARAAAQRQHPGVKPAAGDEETQRPAKVPSNLAQALALTTLSRTHFSKAELAGAAFAGDGQLAALALPHTSSGCEFFRFGLVPPQDAGTHPGQLLIGYWPAPLQEPCTATEALTEARFTTHNPFAGG